MSLSLLNDSVGILKLRVCVEAILREIASSTGLIVILGHILADVGEGQPFVGVVVVLGEESGIDVNLHGLSVEWDDHRVDSSVQPFSEGCHIYVNSEVILIHSVVLRTVVRRGGIVSVHHLEDNVSMHLSSLSGTTFDSDFAFDCGDSVVSGEGLALTVGGASRFEHVPVQLVPVVEQIIEVVPEPPCQGSLFLLLCDVWRSGGHDVRADCDEKIAETNVSEALDLIVNFIIYGVVIASVTTSDTGELHGQYL